jgi:hypothetical protein
MASSSDLIASHRISLETAVDFTKRFRAELADLLQPEYAGALPYSETFPAEVYEKLLSTPGCVSVRTYLGLDEKKNVRLIVVAVDRNNEAILPTLPGSPAEIFEVAQRCPPLCAQGPLDPQ